MEKDTQGRYLILQGKIKGEDITLVNVYAPNERQEEFFENILRSLDKLRKGFTILAGDFNMVMDMKKDKSELQIGEGRIKCTILNRLVNKTGLKDVWRELKGEERKFSFYSQVHNTYSRTDDIFVYCQG